MVLSEGTMEKIPSDTTGIDPGTVRLVAQRSSGKYLLKLNRELFCLMFILHFLASFSLLFCTFISFSCLSFKTVHSITSLSFRLQSFEDKSQPVWVLKNWILLCRHKCMHIHIRICMHFMAFHECRIWMKWQQNMEYIIQNRNCTGLVQAWTGPEGSKSLRIPDLEAAGTWRW